MRFVRIVHRIANFAGQEERLLIQRAERVDLGLSEVCTSRSFWELASSLTTGILDSACLWRYVPSRGCHEASSGG